MQQTNRIVSPDYMTPFIGWRFWKIRKSSQDCNLWLRSVIRNELWPPMERFEAHSSSYKVNKRGSPPEANSTNGIYAYKTSSHALKDIDRCWCRGIFLGKVKLWGVIQRHEFGYRAQYA